MLKQGQPCPCLSGQTYQSCCQPLHQKLKLANNAEQLMRSRYCAFVLGDVDYLINTLHIDQRKANEAELIQQTVDNTAWLGLMILDHKSSQQTAQVEFIAFYQDDDIQQLHERSNFVFEQGQWFYVDGTFLPAIKLKRNMPCFCGSGKKLKHCHMT